MGYEVQVQMGTVQGAGTDANVYIAFHGEKGLSNDYMLNDASDDFEAGTLGIFRLPAAENMGKLDYIRMWQDGSGAVESNSEMYVEWVKVVDDNMVGQDTYEFPYGGWINDNERVFMAAPNVMTTYKVEVKTSDEKNAGTNSNISLTIYGPGGDSGPQDLDNDDNNFEQGNLDTFELVLPNFGSLTKIYIKSDGSGASEGWLLSWLKITDQMTGAWWQFDCNKWLEDGGNLGYELTPTSSGSPS
ncbi:PLAT/LH2 domain-containing protein [Streptosporangium canum]|uniref:PLAT/LH2 domain-containing protein n=1 Tax=Streptosporangium canum TaxID=324952 RepID=UPI00344A5099